jgi:hypothetical protein
MSHAKLLWSTRLPLFRQQLNANQMQPAPPYFLLLPLLRPAQIL